MIGLTTFVKSKDCWDVPEDENGGGGTMSTGSFVWLGLALGICLPLHGQGGTSPGENRLCYKIIEGSVD